MKLPGSILLVLLTAAVIFAENPLYKGNLVPFSEDEELYGYKDPKGTVVITPRYRYAGEFNGSGVASVVESNGKCSLIDKGGNTLLEILMYDNGPDYFESGLARFVEGGKIGFFDQSGKKVIPARYTYAFPFEGNYAIACEGCKKVQDGEHFMMRGGKWFVINKSGNKAAAVDFDAMPSIDGGFAEGKVGTENKRAKLSAN